MGKPGGSHVPSSMNEYIVHEKGTRGTETSKYPEEEKEKSIPSVAASESEPGGAEDLKKSAPKASARSVMAEIVL